MNLAALQLYVAREFAAASGSAAQKRVKAVAFTRAMARFRAYQLVAEQYAATLS